MSFKIQRNQKVIFSEEIGGDGTSFVLAKRLSASEWLQYQQDLYTLDKDSIPEYSAFVIDHAKSWILSLDGFTFSDDTPLTLDDLDYLPVKFLAHIHHTVIEQIQAGKTSEGSQNISTSPADQPLEE
jgi:hypothetical protein